MCPQEPLSPRKSKNKNGDDRGDSNPRLCLPSPLRYETVRDDCRNAQPNQYLRHTLSGFPGTHTRPSREPVPETIFIRHYRELPAKGDIRVQNAKSVIGGNPVPAVALCEVLANETGESVYCLIFHECILVEASGCVNNFLGFFERFIESPHGVCHIFVIGATQPPDEKMNKHRIGFDSSLYQFEVLFFGVFHACILPEGKRRVKPSLRFFATRCRFSSFGEGKHPHGCW